MPEIAEVARVVHYLRKSLVGKTLSVVKAQDDTIVYGKVGTSGAEVQKALQGKKVIDAGRQGKYFWLIMSSPPHPVFHFGMTGWFHVKGEQSGHYRPKASDDAEEWPPKYWKLSLETDSKPPAYAAFTDARRLARIRLVNCAAKDIRNTTPLKENGPDPTLDQHILTEQWFEKKMLSKHVPVKALLLDQANISGIGNWVGDEILYHAKIHPEQYSNTFTSAQLKQLHTSILYVCQTAVDLLADSSKFPDDWLFKHRWGKGKKDAPKVLPNGEKIIHLTVGGRTSCVVPSIQKKTGPTADENKPKKELTSDGAAVGSKAAGKTNGTKKPGRAKATLPKVKNETSDVEDSEESDASKLTKPKVSRKRKTATKEEDEDTEQENEKPTSKSKAKKRKADVGTESEVENEDVKPVPRGRSRKAATEDAGTVKSTTGKAVSKSTSKRAVNVKRDTSSEVSNENVKDVTTTVRRRSGRVSK